MPEPVQVTPRPDPTADLQWGGYIGAIHELFAANAVKHPERTCIVETASSNTPERSFTYAQIHEASNVLAHHFVQHGIERGEVVMVYAHRGVDLVVAVMGVLKAGATFSVIDPQYPPDRQIIYLDVAKPRALVVIEKAVQEAGQLSEAVREYIDDNLKLRTQVPGLVLRDNGVLLGGQVHGVGDCLEVHQSRAGCMPGVVVGPDSIPTLSFTSGSEGRPKGVRGRHFSLAYYFPWMAKRFGLSENDRFSMLSGIAHDPIQRDIFTPLFLGAKLIVPSTDDIAFDRLAKWACDNQITVTHLTPAMGHIMLGSTAPLIESLKNAFFVGDILLKRDCRRLRLLAPNVRIKNMFGTTETQRAVSYYEIPSLNEDPDYLERLGDVVPAGKGMYNVQMLVVDRNDRHRMCEVGEIGEIYVRAAGLAEGYLGPELKDLTATKFVENWFVDPKTWIEKDKELAAKQGDAPWRQYYKGPRDRLYRSGDLGLYNSTGNVEVVGRADDQVKIRGFRIELGEIDTHLSRHPLVRENVTLVKRDHNEEQILVSYYVPDLKKWREWQTTHDPATPVDESLNISQRLQVFGSLTTDIRNLLKKHLASYAVPTLFVPMIRLPLNPNGKVDRPALPYPEKSDLLSVAKTEDNASGAQRTATETVVGAIWASYLTSYTSENIPLKTPLFDLGGNSITAVQILAQIRKKYHGISMPMSALSRNPTLSMLAKDVDQALNPVGLRFDVQDANNVQQEDHYSNSLPDLIKQLPTRINPSKVGVAAKQSTVFLTGATGFLGAYILRDLLNSGVNVIAHVRAKSTDSALERIKQTCTAYGIWSDSWSSQLQCVTGDLENPVQLGMDDKTYQHVAETADIVIHNGAIVHWIKPYASLMAANVMSTLSAIELCTKGKSKTLTFVSSTSVLDNEHYIGLSDKSIRAGGNGVSESDDMAGSKQGLTTGYGQTKWVSEQLVFEARRRGLTTAVVRAGYVLGDSETGSKSSSSYVS